MKYFYIMKKEYKFKEGDLVSYLFGETPCYKVMTTSEKPLVRTNSPAIEVNGGNDYLIIKHPLEAGEFGAFSHVPEAHLELYSKN